MSLFRSRSLSVSPLCVVLVLLVIHSSSACLLHGTDSGYCSTRYHPMAYSSSPEDEYAWLGLGVRERQVLELAARQNWQNGTTEGECELGQGGHCMSFCGRYLFGYKAVQNTYIPCIPRPQDLPKDRNFKDGRFKSHTVRKKDRWVQEFVQSWIRERIDKETDEKAIDEGVDEYGREGRVTAVRFDRNPDCQEAFAAFTCWVNFPRCDWETKETMPMCRSTCENMFQVCGFPEHMWRCGDAEFFNYASYEDGTNAIPPPVTATDPDTGESKKEWYMDFFPGQPFKTNEFTPNPDGEPLPVASCTPAFYGAAASSSLGALSASVAFVGALFILL